LPCRRADGERVPGAQSPAHVPSPGMGAAGAAGAGAAAFGLAVEVTVTIAAHLALYRNVPVPDQENLAGEADGAQRRAPPACWKRGMDVGRPLGALATRCCSPCRSHHRACGPRSVPKIRPRHCLYQPPARSPDLSHRSSLRHGMLWGSAVRPMLSHEAEVRARRRSSENKSVVRRYPISRHPIQALHATKASANPRLSLVKNLPNARIRYQLRH
jgi:hypothetical protein